MHILFIKIYSLISSEQLHYIPCEYTTINKKDIDKYMENSCHRPLINDSSDFGSTNIINNIEINSSEFYLYVINWKIPVI